MSSFRAFQNNFAAIDFSKEIVLPEPKAERPAPKRSDLPCPRLASDIMDPVQSQVSGKMYDSKSALRRVPRDRAYREGQRQTPSVAAAAHVAQASARYGGAGAGAGRARRAEHSQGEVISRS
jgi:hypothetical protein